MTKHWLATAAVFAMMSGAAFAQGASIDTTVSTQSTAAVPPVYSTTKTQRTIDTFGNQTETSQTYKSGSGGTSSRVDTQVRRADGSTESSYREQWSTAPGAVTTLVPSIPPTVIVPHGSVTTLNPDGSTTTTTRTTTYGR